MNPKSTREEIKCCEERYVHLINKEINNLQYVYLERKPHQPGFHTGASRVGFWTVGFCGGRIKSENLKN